MDEKAASIGTILLIVVLAVILLGVNSKLSLYIIISATIIVALISKGGFERGYSVETWTRDYRLERGGEIDDREKKLLIFHILKRVEERKSVDMGEIASDLDVSIYKLNDIIRFLGKHNLVEVIYPPMKSFPIVRESDPVKSRRCRAQIYQSLAKKNFLGKPMKEEFAKEVTEYLENMRRNKNSK